MAGLKDLSVFADRKSPGSLINARLSLLEAEAVIQLQRVKPTGAVESLELRAHKIKV